MKFRLRRVSEHLPDTFGRETYAAPSPSPGGSYVDALEWAAEEDLLVSTEQWASDDPKRWHRLLTALKRTWNPTRWIPDTPRDILVAWASARQRLVEAGTALERLQRAGTLTSHQQATKAARGADISFFGRLAGSLRSRAVQALQEDTEAATLLTKLCSERGREDQS